MKLKLNFAGGSEALFNGKREFDVDVPHSADDNSPLAISRLLEWMSTDLIKDNSKTDMLIFENTVRPGILVLINDTDWEILGGLDATIQDGDNVMFISTLHGG